MAKITIVNRKALEAVKAANGSFQRACVLDAIIGGAATVADVIKIAAPKIDAKGSVQGGDYVCRYYLSELHTNRVIDREGSRGGHGGALKAALLSARNAK